MHAAGGEGLLPWRASPERVVVMQLHPTAWLPQPAQKAAWMKQGLPEVQAGGGEGLLQRGASPERVAVTQLNPNSLTAPNCPYHLLEVKTTTFQLEYQQGAGRAYCSGGASPEGVAAVQVHPRAPTCPEYLPKEGYMPAGVQAGASCHKHCTGLAGGGEGLLQWGASPERVAAVQDQVVAHHVGAGVAGQVDHSRLQVAQIAQPPGWDLVQPCLHQRLQVFGLLHGK